VDSILIDEARTPLIISGPSEGSSDLYKQIERIIPKLADRQDPITNEEGKPDFGPATSPSTRRRAGASSARTATRRSRPMLTEMGLLGEGESLYDAANIVLMHHVYAALRAHALFQRNVDYIVRDGQIIIVDEFTGRTMPGGAGPRAAPGRRGQGGVPIQQENQTMASITFQNLFRLYDKLSGMTGTADTEAYEFQQIYGLEVVVIPTNKPMVRDDRGDLVYLTQEEKYDAIIEDIRTASSAAAGTGGHRLDRDLGAGLRLLKGRPDRARGAERQAARARGRHRRPRPASPAP
jgi:preprotein translocase subunit SecA